MIEYYRTAPKVLAVKEGTEVGNLPLTQTHEGEDREPSTVLHALIHRLGKDTREHGVCAYEGEEEGVRCVLVNLFPFLEIVRFVRDPFDESFQFAHLYLESGEMFLINDGAGGSRCTGRGHGVERRGTYL